MSQLNDCKGIRSNSIDHEINSVDLCPSSCSISLTGQLPFCHSVDRTISCPSDSERF